MDAFVVGDVLRFLVYMGFATLHAMHKNPISTFSTYVRECQRTQSADVAVCLDAMSDRSKLCLTLAN